MPNKVAINGLGRIGRAALKLALEEPSWNWWRSTRSARSDNMVYLLKYDTVYGRYEPQVEAVGKLVIDGTPLAYLSERDPEQPPWADLGVDLVLECTGRFTDRADAGKRWSRSRSSSSVSTSAPASEPVQGQDPTRT